MTSISELLLVSDPDAVDAYMQKLKHQMKDAASELREIILGAHKAIGEEISWNAPTFFYNGKMKAFGPKEYKRFIVGFNFFKKDRVRLIFLRGVLANDPSGLLEGEYKDGRRLALFSSLADVKKRKKDLQKVIRTLAERIHE